MMQQLTLTPQQSKNINLLKGLSIIFVVFIHADVRSMISKYMDVSPAVNLYMETLTRILVDNAVPMFYFISGFLFFLRKDSYCNKFKSRIRTLLVPYLIWVFIGFMIPFVIQRIIGLEHLYSGNQLKLLKDFTAMDYIQMFWNIRDGAPILSTLWFLRDLIVLIAMTPLIAWLTQKLRYVFPLILILIYFFIPFGFSGFRSNGFCWFAMGIYFSLGGVNCWKSMDNIGGKIIIPVWCIMTMLAMFLFYEGIHYKEYMLLYRVVHFIMIYKFIDYLSHKWDVRLLTKISTASFFIYVFHEPWMGYIAQLSISTLRPEGFWVYPLPIILGLFTVSISYSAYMILKRIAPRFLNVATGSR